MSISYTQAPSTTFLQQMYVELSNLAGAQTNPVAQSSEFLDGHASLSRYMPLQHTPPEQLPVFGQHIYVASERDVWAHFKPVKHVESLCWTSVILSD
jgi:hypothetical protein